MSDFRTPVPVLTNNPQDAQDGLNMGNVMPRPNLVPDARNWAEDEVTKRRAQEEIWPLMQQAKRDRKILEANWDDIRRMVMMEHDQNQKYIGRTNAYLPIYSKNAATQITAISRGLFPTDEYMDAVVRNEKMQKDQDRSLKAKCYMMYQFEQIARLRYHMKLWAAQLVDFGWSVLKYWYRGPKPYAQARGKKLGFDEVAKMALYGPEFTKQSSDQGLCVSARSIYNFYAYPFTAPSLRETTLQFEELYMSMIELVHLAKQQGWYKDEIINQAPTPETSESEYHENLNAHNVTAATDQTGVGLAVRTRLTEVYTFLQLPPSAYTPDDAKDCPLPVRILFLGETPVHIMRNKNYNQCSPYLGLSLNCRPGFLIGYGMGKMVAPLQYLGNDFANQTDDVCIYGLNPIVKAVPGMIIGGLRPIAPGVTWYMNDLNAVEIMHPPMEQVGVGMNMLNMIISQAQDFGGAPPIMQGTNAKGSGKTATGSQILQHNAMEPMQDLTEDIETEVLIPLAEGTWSLAQQYAPESLLATVFDMEMEITKDDLLAQAEMKWQASSQSSNKQQRNAQAMQFLGQLIPVIPLLQQQGVQVNLKPLFKRIFSDTMGFRGFDEVFVQMNPAQQMQAMMQAQAGQGGPGGAPGPQDPRSTTEQNPMLGGGQPMVPGEGEAFGEVRDNSDDLSAMLGGMNGGE